MQLGVMCRQQFPFYPLKKKKWRRIAMPAKHLPSCLDWRAVYPRVRFAILFVYKTPGFFPDHHFVSQLSSFWWRAWSQLFARYRLTWPCSSFADLSKLVLPKWCCVQLCTLLKARAHVQSAPETLVASKPLRKTSPWQTARMTGARTDFSTFRLCI